MSPGSAATYGDRHAAGVGLTVRRDAIAVAVPAGAARAALAATAAVAVAAAAHTAGHGQLDPAGLGWAMVLLLGPSWWLTRRERSWGAHALTQLGAQQAVHAALSTTAVHPVTQVPHDVMLYAHVVAAALVAGWLRWGESRAWSAAIRLVSSGIVRILATPPAAPPVTVPPGPARRLPTYALRHALARRGPPAPARI
jgi:hypothetical protein